MDVTSNPLGDARDPCEVERRKWCVIVCLSRYIKSINKLISPCFSPTGKILHFFPNPFFFVFLSKKSKGLGSFSKNKLKKKVFKICFTKWFVLKVNSLSNKKLFQQHFLWMACKILNDILNNYLERKEENKKSFFTQPIWPKA